MHCSSCGVIQSRQISCINGVDRYITIIFQSTSYKASYIATYYLLAPIWFLRAFSDPVISRIKFTEM